MKLGKKGYSVLFTVLFFLLLGFMDYPFVSRIVNERNMGEAVYRYRGNISDQKEELEKRRAEAERYNQSLAAGRGVAIQDAFTDGEETPDEAYSHLLDIDGTGVMGIIRIPKIDVELPIYHGTSEEVLQKGAGHLRGSSLPLGGEDTHVCVSAHRGLPNKQMFTRLDELEEGDLFFLESLGETLAYKVTDIRTVEPGNVRYLEIQKDRDLATLITCTPYGINTQRLYVTGERTPYTEGTEAQAEAQQGQNWFREWWWVPLNILLLAIMVTLLYRFNRKSRVPEEIGK